MDGLCHRVGQSYLPSPDKKGVGVGGRLALVFALIPVFSAVLGTRQLQVVGGWFVCVGVLVYNTPLITRAVIVAICP